MNQPQGDGEHAFSQVLVFMVGHYNPVMVFSLRILGRLHALRRRHGLAALVIGAAVLAGCGQKGPLFLPVPPKVTPSTVVLPNLADESSEVIVPALPVPAAR